MLEALRVRTRDRRRQLVERIYTGLHPSVVRAAADSVLAHLIKLRDEGKVVGARTANGATWHAVIERLFQLPGHRTTVRTELVAGVTTFLAMAYIIFVQPAVLSAAGMDFGAVMVATCLASAIRHAPDGAARELSDRGRAGDGPQLLLRVHGLRGDEGAVADRARRGRDRRHAVHPDGATVGLRERLIVAIPASLKHAIAVGIGLLVALDRPAVGRPGRRLARARWSRSANCRRRRRC